MTRPGASEFKDHFSQLAAQYAASRPVYPVKLVQYLATLCTSHDLAWDAGCGSGQLSTLLATEFNRVIATDASAQQIAMATPHSKVDYRCARAETCGLAGHSVDMCTCAQAAHWFDLPTYYMEVRRVSNPGGVLALVSYGIMTVDSPIDAVVLPFYRDVLGPYWPSERKLVEEGYRMLEFPFEEVDTPCFEMLADWNLAEYIGYIETWSAVWAMAKSVGRASLEELHRALALAWGDPLTLRRVRWPLALRVGLVK